MFTLIILILLTIIAIAVTILLLFAGVGALCLLPIISDVVIFIAAVKIIKNKGGDKK